MFIKYKNLTKTTIIFSLFLFIGFLFLLVEKTFAIALEVQYPPIKGISLNTDPNLTLPRYILYLFNAGTFIGFFGVFISLVIAGIMYLLSPAKPDLQADAKDRITGSISGLLILTLSYLIITTINPQLSFLTLTALPEIPPPPPEKQEPGVYFFDTQNCSSDKISPNVSSIPDFEKLKNKIQSVGIVQNPDSDIYYISVLYNNPGLWGKCQYITTTDPNNPNQTCQNVDPFASSASIYKYDFNPLENNDPFTGGVYFYRKSCFYDYNFNTSSLIDRCNKNSGGYYYVSVADISTVGVFDLNELQFNDVPLDEQACKKYDKNGNCCTKDDAELECDEDGRTPQTLGGENISSIIINGNFLVILVYFDPLKDSDFSWSSCQEFPTTIDANKIGPQQIKWENIRNSGGVVPNYAVIIPIKK